MCLGCSKLLQVEKHSKRDLFVNSCTLKSIWNFWLFPMVVCLQCDIGLVAISMFCHAHQKQVDFRRTGHVILSWIYTPFKDWNKRVFPPILLADLLYFNSSVWYSWWPVDLSMFTSFAEVTLNIWIFFPTPKTDSQTAMQCIALCWSTVCLTFLLEQGRSSPRYSKLWFHYSAWLLMLSIDMDVAQYVNQNSNISH